MQLASATESVRPPRILIVEDEPALRFLVAFGVLTVATTLALGLVVREVWRSAEERRFQAQFKAAMPRLERWMS